jgi:parvulin-like peptidyl-prolyl isomerase
VCGLEACAKLGPWGGAGDADAGAQRGAVVARVGGVELREDDLERIVARDPGGSPARLRDPVARRELVAGLVRFELLAQAAERTGLTRDPDAVYAQRQIAVSKLVNQALGSAASPEAVTPADVEREYAAHLADEFTLPPAAHVRHVRVADAKLAARLAERARALAANDDEAFAALVAKHAEDDAARATGGDLGFVDENSRLPPALVQAALQLKTPGEVAGPLALGDGYAVLRLVSRRAPAVSPRSSVEEVIRQRLYRERRAKSLDAYIEKLRSETKVELVTP